MNLVKDCLDDRNNFDNLLLSVIIIARNEEKVIDMSIKAAIKACRRIFTDNEVELVIVNSASTDKTIETSIETLNKLGFNNWKIITYKSSRFTAALSREIGRKYINGKYILFLDADMLLYHDFLTLLNDTEFIDNDKVAGIVGRRIDLLYKNDMTRSKLVRFKMRCCRNGIVFNTGGGLLLKKTCIENIHFNIEQRSREEEAFVKKLAANNRYIKLVDKNMYLHLNYKTCYRNIRTKIQMIKESTVDSFNALRVHKKYFGLKSALKYYFDYLWSYHIFPILLFMSMLVSITNSDNYVITIVLFFLLSLYIRKYKLLSISFVFLPYAMFNTLECPVYEVTDIISRNK